MNPPTQATTNPPKVILELVERFEAHLDEYRSGRYNETQLRRDFLDPFWKALGWDIDNENDYAEAYRDVVHEDAVKVGDATKAPDYGFRIGGARKFFLEAKKPSVVVKDDIPAAYQLRRYAWSAKLPLSILSDFEEFAVYDARVKPAPNDPASTARLFYCTFRDYAANWAFIEATFSRDAVLKGSFDRYADSKTKKRGTASVDDAFLDEIEGWRKVLAQNLALRNEKLTQRELNFAVQRIIDRVIFLRICEDRGIEKYGRLRALAEGEAAYSKLTKLFREADDRYNSGLFHFSAEKERGEEPDLLTPRLKVDDKVLRDMFKGLYYPQSPYEFSVISADMLGQVYERFLGNTIELSESHRAKVVEKPEVRKAGGVYYTPTYIVDYIVKNAVGTLLEGKTPKQAAKLKVLDPACGSGSFLIGAYQFLLDWHLAWYVKDGASKHATGKKPVLHQTQGGGWALTLAERKRILLDNIHGVDIDSQAVEVTKLSLVLKVLEGETDQSVNAQLKLFQERALPDLGSNIKCGNSLIGPDLFAQKELGAFSEEERYRINVFDWKTEFPEIMKAGGFDAVIGNPPYVRQESISSFKNYFQSHYEAFDGGADLYTFFMENGVKLLRVGGLFSIIVSSSFLRATYGAPLRRTLKKYAAVLRIVDFGGLAVFSQAKDTYVCVPLLEKGAKPKVVEVCVVESLENLNLAEHVAVHSFRVPHDRLSEEAWSLKSDAEAAVFAKVMRAGQPLGEYVAHKMFYGLKTGLNEAFEVSGAQRNALIKDSSRSKALIKPFLGGQDIRRYRAEDKGRFLIVIPSGWTRQQMARSYSQSSSYAEGDAWKWFNKECPAIAAHLGSFTPALKARQDKGDYWWELRPCDYYKHLEAPKIVFPDICKAPRFHIDRSGVYLANTAYCLGTDDLYLLGFLNSRLFWFAIGNISIPFGTRAGEYRYRLIYQYMEKVPVRVLNLKSNADKAAHDKMVSMVEQMLESHRQLPTARTPQEKTSLDRQIAATDAQIDRLVYDLYGLTEDEIKIVEGA